MCISFFNIEIVPHFLLFNYIIALYLNIRICIKWQKVIWWLNIWNIKRVFKKKYILYLAVCYNRAYPNTLYNALLTGPFRLPLIHYPLLFITTARQDCCRKRHTCLLICNRLSICLLLLVQCLSHYQIIFRLY